MKSVLTLVRPVNTVTADFAIRLDPALQGGADYTHNPTGLYAGTWLSTIKWTKDAGGSGDVEWDIYFGKKAKSPKTGRMTWVC
jgi:hypothetical protein